MAHLNDHINQVARFHEIFKIGNEKHPNVDLALAQYELRYRLFKEEADEYLEACKAKDLNEVADALGDMQYILLGTVLKHGLQNHFAAIFDEIQRSNMSKLDELGAPIFREDGKVLKSALFNPPNIDSILKRKNFSVQRFHADDKTLFDTACQIREQVFVVEQNVDRTEEYDEFEKQAVHYLAFADNLAVGTCRWRLTDNGIKLERYAVLAQWRKNRVGEVLLETALGDVRHLGRKVYLHGQLHAVPFYEKYGFVKEGDLFTEADIEHYKMFYKM